MEAARYYVLLIIGHSGDEREGGKRNIDKRGMKVEDGNLGGMGII